MLFPLIESVGQQLIQLGGAASLEHLRHALLVLGWPGLGRCREPGWTTAPAFPRLMP
jgi:hypothetical protein